jgi:hypothetical protein
MLSIAQCSKILNSNGKKYTNEEVEQIRNLLYTLGQIDYQHFQTIQHGKEGRTLRKSINGRTTGQRVQSARSNQPDAKTLPVK